MPALAPDPARPSIADRTGDDDLSASDPATARLRSLLAPEDPWRDRIDGERFAHLIDSLRARRAVAVVLAAVAIGIGAFLVVGAGSSSSVDPVQVLPRVEPLAAPGPASGAAAPAAAAGAGGGGDAIGAGTSVPAAPATIQVHAAGAVAVPGVHELGDGSRVADLIRAAGGLAVDADPDRINLAAPVHDGERVYVPRRGETDAPVVVAGGPGGAVGGEGAGSPGGDGTGPATTVADPIDINAADAAALDALPGVGPATADAIIRHRTANGPFRSVDDLQEVAGIGPAKLARLRDLVRVG